jgi:hypothetical protein
VLVSFVIEPFISQSIVRPLNDAAYPRDVFGPPLLIGFLWANATDDRAGFAAVKAAQASVTQAVIKDGQSLKDVTLYPNYAFEGTTLQSLYGANVPTLKSLRHKYDPTG